MRVLISGWFLDQPHTGSGQYLYHLLKSLLAYWPEHEYVVAAPQVILDRAAPEWRGFPVRFAPVSVQATRMGKVFFEHVSLPLACRRARAEVVLVPYWGGPIWAPCPVVVNVLDLIPILLPEYRGGMFNRFYSRLAAAAACRATELITLSEASRQDILRIWPVDPACVHAIYLAYDGGAPEDGSAERCLRVRQKYALPNRYLLYFGGFDSRKNIETMFQAYARARLSLAGVSLVVAGNLPRPSKSQCTDVRSLARRWGVDPDTHFIGPFDESERTALLKMASAFVYLSRYEGFGLPVLEAMATGVPVVASQIPATVEVAGAAAVLRPPGDVAGIAAALRSVVTDGALAAELGEKGRRRAREFSWQRCAAETERILRRAAGQPAARPD